MPEDQVFTRVMPHSEEAERSVIGAMMLNKDAIDIAQESVAGEDFYNRQLGAYFDAITELHASGREVDPVTLGEKIKEKNLPPEYMSPAFISSIVTAVPTSANIREYAGIVRENAVKRKIIKVSEEFMNDSYSGVKELDVILGDMEKNVFALTQRAGQSEYVPMSAVLMSAMNHISDAGKMGGFVTGNATGFVDLDKDTAGFQPSDLILIAARPSMGKTAFALNVAEHMAVREHKCVAIFSLEMSKEQLATRLISMVSHVSASKLRTGDLTDTDWVRIVEAVDILAATKIIIDDTPGITVTEMRSKCRKYKIEHDLDVVFVDYLQLMNATRGRAPESRQQEISEISRSLKALARELQVPVVALSQLSRAVESRTDHRPVLSDLRESGAIEQDADVVMFIYREDYYKKDTDRKGISEIIIAKQRNGPIGTVELVWIPEHTRFANKAY